MVGSRTDKLIERHTMKQTKTELTRMIEQLSIDPVWKCYTRAALSLRWAELTSRAVSIVYCDIDDMHGLNAKYTHAGTDERISKIIANVRHDTADRYGDVVASRWLNGDELVFILGSGDGQDFCERMQSTMLDNGINGTFCHSNVITDSPEDTINVLDAKVQQSKNHNVRGVIIT